MKTIIITIAALVLINGCASLGAHWSDTGYGGIPRDRALAECDFEAEKAAAAAHGDRDQLFARTDVLFACMRAKGFTLVKASSPA